MHNNLQGPTRDSSLSFPILLIEGRTISTLGEAADFFSRLTEQKRQENHWRIAIRMLDHALREPVYLKTATMSFQTALAMDGVLDQIQT